MTVTLLRSVILPRVVGLTGLAGSGKSTIARELVQVYRATPCSLATWFKVPSAAQGAPLAEVFGVIPKTPKTRSFLQRRGTEEGRDVHGDDWWIRHADADLYRLGSYGVELVVVDDVRFRNEAEWVNSIPDSLLVRLHRDGAGLAGEEGLHRSERDIPDLPGAIDIDNNRPAEQVRRIIADLLWPDSPF